MSLLSMMALTTPATALGQRLAVEALEKTFGLERPQLGVDAGSENFQFPFVFFLTRSMISRP